MKALSLKIQTRLDDIKGKSFLYHGDQLNVLDFKINGEKVQIVTDNGWHEPSYEEVESFLDKLLPIKDEYVSETGMAVVQQARVTSSSINVLKSILMDNIKKVQESKDYIPQAQEINHNVKSIIEVAKAEIEVLKIMKS